METHKEIEKFVKTFWKKNETFQKIKNKNSKGDEFVMCDGPPYPIGEVNLSTIRNKIIKDCICRYKRFKGYNVITLSGFDVHGLPIETAIETKLNIKTKKDIEKFGINNYIKECKKYVNAGVKKYILTFNNHGIWMDHENHYTTMEDKYIESVWKTINIANDKQLLNKKEKVLPFCTRCETVVTNYELNYKEVQEMSIYVKFQTVEDKNKYYIVWTSSPWSIISNNALMVHPTSTYVEIQVNNETWIIAKQKIDDLPEQIRNDLKIIKEFSGKKIEDQQYVNPLTKQIKTEGQGIIILSDEFVNFHQGTGIINCTSGHNPHDYILAKRFDLPIHNLINDDGTLNKKAGKYVNLSISMANKTVTKDLENKKLIILKNNTTHRKPHCWQCDSQLIYKKSDQWFIDTIQIKDELLNKIDKIAWYPKTIRLDMRNYIIANKEWCISRDRYWGTPLPIWTSQDTIKIISSRTELPPIHNIHKPDIDNIEITTNDNLKLKRVTKITDVWMDSGNVLWANQNKDYVKVDLIIENQKQVRGWFYSLLVNGIIRQNDAPYVKALSHGVIKSNDNHNQDNLKTITNKYGIDTLRLWILSTDYSKEIEYNSEQMIENVKKIDTVLNIAKYINEFNGKNQNLIKTHDDNDNNFENEINHLEDQWILSKFNNLIKQCNEDYECLKYYSAVNKIEHFINKNVSKQYLKFVKNRNDDHDQLANYILNHVFVGALKLIAPALPFVTEYLYLKMFNKSIFIDEWPTYNATLSNPRLEIEFDKTMQIIQTIKRARQTANIKLRWPIKNINIVTSESELINIIEKYNLTICKMTNIKKITLNKILKTNKKIIFYPEIVNKNYELIQQLTDKISDKDITQIDNALLSNNQLSLHGFDFNKNNIEIMETNSNYSISRFKHGKIYLPLEIPTEMFNEGIINEIIRRIQQLRKDKALNKTDKIIVKIETQSKQLKDIIKSKQTDITTKVNAKKILFENNRGKQWQINKFKLKIGITKN